MNELNEGQVDEFVAAEAESPETVVGDVSLAYFSRRILECMAESEEIIIATNQAYSRIRQARLAGEVPLDEDLSLFKETLKSYIPPYRKAQIKLEKQRPTDPADGSELFKNSKDARDFMALVYCFAGEKDTNTDLVASLAVRTQQRAEFVENLGALDLAPLSNVELCHEYRIGHPGAAEEIINRHKGLANLVMNNRRRDDQSRTYLDGDDFEQLLCLELLRRADTYNGQASFSTHYLGYIFHWVTKWKNLHSRGLSIDHQTALKLGTMSRMVDIGASLKLPPLSNSHIAQLMAISEAEVMALKRIDLLSRLLGSIDKGSSGYSTGGLPLEETAFPSGDRRWFGKIDGDDPTPDEFLDPIFASLALEKVTSDITNPTSRNYIGKTATAVLNKRFGLSGEQVCSLREIGDSLGLTHQRIFQIEATVLAKMRTRFQVAHYRSLLKGNETDPIVP